MKVIVIIYFCLLARLLYYPETVAWETGQVSVARTRPEGRDGRAGPHDPPPAVLAPVSAQPFRVRFGSIRECFVTFMFLE